MRPSPEGTADGLKGRAAARRFFSALAAGANAISTAWILALMALVVADVFLRNAFLAPIPGVPEIVKYSIVGIVFLQIAHTHEIGAMIRSDGLLELLGRRNPMLAAILDATAQFSGMILTLALAYAGWPRIMRAIARGEMAGTQGHFLMPVWPFYAIMIAGSLMLSISFAFALYDSISRMRAVRGAGR